MRLESDDMFKELIDAYEFDIDNNTVTYNEGVLPILITAAHTMNQLKSDNTIKPKETYTKAIARYVSEATECHSLIKNNVTGIDSNSNLEDIFKDELIRIIKEKDIKLVIDLHGAKMERDFDVELGTLNNLSADYSTIKELIDAFNEHGIKKVSLNKPFKGGGITQKVFSETGIDVIQLEINGRYRSSENNDAIKQVCDSLIAYIKQYSNFN